MSWRIWTLFLGFTFLVSGAPGPNMLMVMSTSVRYGARPALATMGGCLVALLSMMSLSAAGLGALLLAFPRVFDALRWAGAAYLVWLGWKSWRAPVAGAPDVAAGGPAGEGPGAPEQAGPPPNPAAAFATAAPGALFRQGMWVSFSNPKAIVFAAALFPQFIVPDQPTLPQFLILLGTFAVIESGWYLVYAAMGQRLSAWLRRANVMRGFNRLTGGIFVAFAAWLAAARA